MPIYYSTNNGLHTGKTGKGKTAKNSKPDQASSASSSRSAEDGSGPSGKGTDTGAKKKSTYGQGKGK